MLVIEYAICGGVALAIHGAPRATKDIDLLAREADLPRLREVVRTCGFTLEALPMTFSSGGISIRRSGRPGRASRSKLQVPPRARCGSSRRPAWSRSSWGPADIVDIQRLEEVSRGEHDA
jgi:hypothetical protein